MPKHRIGLQLYTLRDLMAEDFAGTLREVAKIGYQGVEFAGYGGYEAEELRSLLDELGLSAIGSHVMFERMLEAGQEEIDFMKKLGGKYIAIPVMFPPHRASAEAWQEACSKIASIGELCRENGIQLLYHNHQFEFTEHFDGRPIQDILFDSVSADLLQMELDACWTYAAGYDPLAYMRRFKDRLPLLHVKDYRPSEKGPLTVELGEGIVPLEDIVKEAAATNCEWLIVEQDICTNPPLDSVRKSYNWLKNHL